MSRPTADLINMFFGVAMGATALMVVNIGIDHVQDQEPDYGNLVGGAAILALAADRIADLLKVEKNERDYQKKINIFVECISQKTEFFKGEISRSVPQLQEQLGGKKFDQCIDKVINNKISDIEMNWLTTVISNINKYPDALNDLINKNYDINTRYTCDVIRDFLDKLSDEEVSEILEAFKENRVGEALKEKVLNVADSSYQRICKSTPYENVINFYSEKMDMTYADMRPIIESIFNNMDKELALKIADNYIGGVPNKTFQDAMFTRIQLSLDQQKEI